MSVKLNMKFILTIPLPWKIALISLYESGGRHDIGLNDRKPTINGLSIGTFTFTLYDFELFQVVL